VASRSRPTMTLRLAVAFVALWLGAAVASPPPPHVYVVLFDGLDAGRMGEMLMPTLWQLAHGGFGPATYYPRGRAVMSAVTNPNHASVMTGVYPAAHGVVGNLLWDRTAGHAIEGSETAVHLEVETLFTVMKAERPRARTAALFGKSRLAGLF